MLIRKAAVEHARLFQVIHDLVVCVFDEDPRIRHDFGREATLCINRHDQGQIVRPTHLHVLGPERRSYVHDAGALGRAHKISADHEPGLLVRLHEMEKRLIRPSQQLRSWEGLFHHGFRGQDGLHQILSHYQVLVAQVHRCVRDVGTHGRCHVGDERPRRGGPDQ